MSSAVSAAKSWTSHQSAPTQVLVLIALLQTAIVLGKIALNGGVRASLLDKSVLQILAYKYLAIAAAIVVSHSLSGTPLGRTIGWAIVAVYVFGWGVVDLVMPAVQRQAIATLDILPAATASAEGVASKGPGDVVSSQAATDATTKQEVPVSPAKVMTAPSLLISKDQSVGFDATATAQAPL
jgi:hypothetical protein